MIMILESNEIQEITGFFQCNGQAVGKELYRAEICFKRFNVHESYILFNDHIPQLWRNESFCFVIDSKYKFYLNHTSQYWSPTYSETKFLIDKLVIEEKRKKYVRTGAVKQLVYFPKELNIAGYKLRAKEYRYEDQEKIKRKTYFEWAFEQSISKEEIDKVLMVISVLSCSSFFISEISDGEKVVIHNFESTEGRVPYSGSGNMSYPIQIDALEKLISEVKWKDLDKFHLAYKSFCRTENLVFQLYNGCAILDWLIDLFDRNLKLNSLKKKIKSKRQGKSARLYCILYFLELDEKVKVYLESIFPGTSFLEFTWEKNFEFY